MDETKTSDFKSKASWLAPIVVLLLLAGGDWLMWRQAEDLTDKLISQVCRDQAEEIDLRIADFLDERESDLALLAMHWTAYPEADRETHFLNDAAQLILHESAYWAINFIDKRGEIRLSAPAGYAPPEFSGRNSKSSGREDIQSDVSRTGMTLSSPPVKLASGAPGIIIFLPIADERKPSNADLIAGTLNVDRIVKKSIVGEIPDEFHITIDLMETRVFDSDSTALHTDAALEKRAKTHGILVLGRKWSVTASLLANHPLADRPQDNWERFVITLCVAVFAAALLAFAVSALGRLRRNRQKLRRKTAMTQKYLDTAAVILVVLDDRGQITLINKKGCRILEWEEENIVGKNWFDTCLAEKDREETRRVFRLIMEGRISLAEHHENPVVTKSGRRRVIDWYNSELRNDEGRITGVLSSGEDITERKALQEQLLQSQKLESIGRLAGGVAHDFNNLLTPIVGYTELAIQELDDKDPLQEKLEIIRKAALQSKDLVRQLLAFGRKQLLDIKTLNLNTIVRDFENMIKRLLREDIDLSIFLDPALGLIRADRSQVEQVLMNLVVNAGDAMPEGGTLTIETLNAGLDHEYAKTHKDVTPGPYVMLAISDSGIGMDAETQSHIFEPFFTTKERGKGTGLGLATVHGIVKQHGGHLWIYSEPNKGTTIKAYLPRTQENAAAETAPIPAPAPPSEKRPGHETVLILEDDETVLSLSVRILERGGYRMLRASNASQARQVAGEYEGEIDLLLTDVVLPGMNGKQFFDELVSLRPSLRVLFMSGYTENVIAHRGVLDEGMRFLHKPFTTDGLLEKVRQVLGEAVRS